MSACRRCGACLSRYAPPSDAYCWPCHPRIESSRQVCAQGHDLSVHGVMSSAGTRDRPRQALRCKKCREVYNLRRSVIRRSRREGTR